MSELTTDLLLAAQYVACSVFNYCQASRELLAIRAKYQTLPQVIEGEQVVMCFLIALTGPAGTAALAAAHITSD